MKQTELFDDTILDRVRQVSEVAAVYKQKGYRVMIEPSADQLPDFLRTLRPDMVAIGPDDSIAVEIKSLDKAEQSEKWKRLAEVIRQQPGWRFDVVTGGNTAPSAFQNISRVKIEARLEEGYRLAQEERLEAALLITWSAVEAAMRLVGKRKDVDFPDTRPGTVISKLYMDGLLDREDYDSLIEAMSLRNRVAHGFKGGDRVSEKSVHRLQEIAKRLLCE